MTRDWETAATHFEDLQGAFDRQSDVRKSYGILRHVFGRIVDAWTCDSLLQFSGPFAKLDYIAKEHLADKAPLALALNDLRVRLRALREQGEADLQQTLPYDVRALCEFVSILYGTPIPLSLRQRLPSGKPQSASRQLQGKCLRVMVISWDETHIDAYTDAEGASRIRICYDLQGDKFAAGDWTYLRRLLSEGTQLNLVKPRVEHGIYYPEQIIFEPDYLVDISSIAACFEPYGTTPHIHLINKIKPNEMTKPMLLGNFASLLLDEAIHETEGKEASYKDCVQKFFRQNALCAATCLSGESSGFHADAQRQMRNIRQAIRHQLSQASPFDRERAMLEPTFFCEMLGIQGRMDFLQDDRRILVEQKSGKGAFPCNEDIPRQQEKHYVQLLLYMALLHYNHGMRNEEIYSFLLYSKYPKGLLKLGAAPKLLFEALRIRNQLTWCEMSYATTDGARMLERLSPQHLNSNRVGNSLWTRYAQPELERLLTPFHTSSPLERAYFFRMFRFLELEHLLAKIGNKTKQCSGFSSVWNASLEEKRMAGNIYDGLSLLECRSDTNDARNIGAVLLKMPSNTDCALANFRRGDIVILYPYPKDKEPDARQTMVLRATIEELSDDDVLLRLRAPQSSRHIFQRPSSDLWAIEHDFFDASFSSLYRGLYAFLTAPPRRRDLILAQRKAETDTSTRRVGDYGCESFNQLVLRAKQAKDYFLIVGPPGTGKTSFGLLNVLKEELLNPASNVLLVSYTNRAVDEICSKLVAENIDFLRIGSELNCAPEYRQHLLASRMEDCGNAEQVKNLLLGARVFTGTTTAFNAHLQIFGIKPFDLAIIDEASQILEPHLLPLLSAQHKGAEAVRKFVFIGDHKQLPAVVQQTERESAVSEPELQQIGLHNCRLSLFERLLNLQRNTCLVHTLTKQGRMHPDIAAFPNLQFYNNQLDAVPLPHQTESLPKDTEGRNAIGRLLATRRLSFVSPDLSALSMCQSHTDTPDKVNLAEADMIAAVVVAAYRQAPTFHPDETIGVIVPYRNQILAVRSAIARHAVPALHDITIDTVERFQGSQRDTIVYGFTVKRPYQLDFLTDNTFTDTDSTLVDRKLNVAMTRARRSLVMIGNARLLSRVPTFRCLIDYARMHQSFFDVPPEDFCQGTFSLEHS